MVGHKNPQEHIDSLISNKVFSEKQREAVRRFVKSQQANRFEYLTIRGDLYFLHKIASISDKPFEEYTKEDIQQILELPVCKKSKFYHRKIRQFWRFLNEGELPKSVRWVDPRNKNRERKEDKKVLTDEQKKNMIDLTTNQRDKTMLLILFDTGCRPGELISLKIKDVVFDQNGGVVKLKGKTGERTRRLFDSLPDVKLYLTFHKYKDNRESPLFYNLSRQCYGKPITYQAIYYLFNNLKKQMGIEGNFSSYVTRRTALTEMGKRLTPHELKTFAGHSSITTSNYYVRIKQEDVDNKLMRQSGMKEQEVEEIKESALKPTKCFQCKKTNGVGSKFCSHCGFILDRATALQYDEIRTVGDNVMAKTLKHSGKIDREALKETIGEMIDEGVITKRFLKILSKKQKA